MSIEPISVNRKNLEDFAIRLSLEPNREIRLVNGGPSTVDKLARSILINYESDVIFAFEVVLFMRSNLRAYITYQNEFYRILSKDDCLKVCVHVMDSLRKILKAHKTRPKGYEMNNFQAVAQQISGSFTRDRTISIWTGKGIHFTGLTKLYYDCTHLSKVQAIKRLVGQKSSDVLFTISSFPKEEQISSVVASCMQFFN